MLFSANQQAHWDFADLASSAYVDWLYHCDREDYEANVRLRDEHGLLELFSSPEPNRDDTDKRLRLEAAEYLPDYLRDVMQRAGALRPIDSIEVVYGEMLGRARVTHLRAAIKQLHAAGVVDDDGRGDFWERVITWTGG
jgi:hypothetical protein